MVIKFSWQHSQKRLIDVTSQNGFQISLHPQCRHDGEIRYMLECAACSPCLWHDTFIYLVLSRFFWLLQDWHYHAKSWHCNGNKEQSVRDKQHLSSLVKLLFLDSMHRKMPTSWLAFLVTWTTACSLHCRDCSPTQHGTVYLIGLCMFWYILLTVSFPKKTFQLFVGNYTFQTAFDGLFIKQTERCHSL